MKFKEGKKCATLLSRGGSVYKSLHVVPHVFSNPLY